MPGWRAWLPTDPKRGPLRRACPACLSAGTVDAVGFTLVSQLPLTLSCPEHGCHLELAFGGLGAFVAWEKPDTQATAVPERVVAMDRRTHEALRTGAVRLPRRPVHAGVWFRLLRTLLDELSTPVSALGTRSRRTIEHIWQITGHPPRAGIIGPWRLYEAMPWPQQQAFLEAAATALHLTETGKITARGTLAPLLTAEPHRHVDGGAPPVPVAGRRDYWKEARDAMTEAIALAQQDPAAANQLLSTLTALTRSEAAFQRIRDDLIALGIPKRHLSPSLADARAPRDRDWPLALSHRGG